MKNVQMMMQSIVPASEETGRSSSTGKCSQTRKSTQAGEAFKSRLQAARSNRKEEAVEKKEPVKAREGTEDQVGQSTAGTEQVAAGASAQNSQEMQKESTSQSTADVQVVSDQSAGGAVSLPGNASALLVLTAMELQAANDIQAVVQQQGASSGQEKKPDSAASTQSQSDITAVSVPELVEVKVGEPADNPAGSKNAGTTGPATDQDHVSTGSDQNSSHLDKSAAAAASAIDRTDARGVDQNAEQSGFTLVQSGSSAVKSQSENQNQDIKQVMDFASQRFNPNTVDSKEGKEDGSQTPSESGNNTDLTVLTQHVQTAKDKTAFKETLQSEASSPKTTVDPQELMSQVVKKAELMSKQGSSEMNIQLKPEFLGKMTIKVAMEDGTVTARFITDSQQVKNILDQNIQSLRHTLEAQGIKVDKTEVDVQLDSGGMFGGFDGRQQGFWQQQESKVSSRPAASISEASRTDLAAEVSTYSQPLDPGQGSDAIDYRI